jgi:hypothetical protein
VYIVMEYAPGGDLASLLSAVGRLDDAAARVVAADTPHLGEDVAVKLMDLESASLSLDEIVREAATMRIAGTTKERGIW